MSLFGKAFDKAKAFVWWQKLGLKLSGAKDAIEKEIEMEAEKPEPQKYDIKVTLAKGAKTLAVYAGALAVGAILTAFVDANLVAGRLEAAGVSHQVSAALGGAIAFIAEAGRNYLKNRNLGAAQG